ncbi:MAG: Nif3-like dinuclear metal center hexameric protein [Granulosicoccus sp.]|nr:Nif3-like dinuclear metal center hexameric protein [Granulosicoccus sp.]
MAALDDIANYCNRLLNIADVKDYCPNGVQVQGSPSIRRMVSGVTASDALIRRAIELDADALLVHHGYFWRGESAAITGMKYQRLKQLLAHDIALLAYHLPLDIHREYGNNVGLGRALELEAMESIEAGGTRDLFWRGRLNSAETTQAFSARVKSATGRDPLLVGPADKLIEQVGWCTGGAQQFIDLAADLSLDAFISGEISEQTTHIARERGIVYVAAGHHATERFGVQSLGTHLAEHFGLGHDFVDIENPA